MTVELTVEEKEYFMKIIGERIGDEFANVVKEFKQKSELYETRHKLTQTKLDTIIAKLDGLKS